MENLNIIKQAKSDIFKELKPIIDFYIKKGATPAALKKYYKNTKRLNDLQEDIKNKGINLVKDEEEYKKLVKEILNDLLDDFIAKQKDEEYKNKEKNMKHIKEFNHFEFKKYELGVEIGDKVEDFMGDLYEVTDISDDLIELTPISYEGDKSYFPQDFGKDIHMDEFWTHLIPYEEKN